MENRLHEECGVFGLFNRNEEQLDTAKTVYYALYALQHRGQEACGIAVNDHNVINLHKDLGLVHEVFDESVLSPMRGSIAIGHVRYSTTGGNNRRNIQPLGVDYIKGSLVIAHNGNISNAAVLRQELEKQGAIFQCTSDTEVIAFLIAKGRLSAGSVEEAVQRVLPRLEGSFSLLVMSPRKLIAARDAKGMRPLCMGRIDDSVIFASETCALDAIGARFERDVAPGEMIVVEQSGQRSLRWAEQCRPDQCALIGAKMLGPRIGKYDKNGRPKAITGHSIPLSALGVFILWFCWFGFNGGSTLGIEGDLAADAGRVFMTTNLATAVSTTTVMIITWIRYRKPDVSMTLNGSLAGLVAITAGCDVVSPFGAAVIGLVAGFAVVFGIEFMDKVLKIDDPVGAVGVHFVNGSLGTLLTGLFAVDGGLFYGGGFQFFGVQCLGVISVMAWTAVTITIVFTILKKTVGLRVAAEEELMGLDIPEHGLVSAYADFAPMPDTQVLAAQGAPVITGSAPIDEAIPVQVASEPKAGKAVASDVKMTKITIITKQSRFEALKAAMNGIGVTGMTVTNVLGCGMQKGRTEYYRGVEMEMNLLPKIEVEIVVCKVPVRTVIDAAKKVLYTGNIGDGKIFVYDVENVVKVRTGQEGYDALQDVE